MNNMASGAPESLSQRIKTLEGLILQQKEFIDHTSTLWRGLLETEQARSRQNEDIRITLESRMVEMEKDRNRREDDLTAMRSQLEEDRARQKSAEESARKERERVTLELAALESDVAQKLALLETLTAQLAKEEAKNTQLLSDKSDLRQNVTQAETRLEMSREQVAKLEQDVAKAENILRQRQEEIEQTLSLLAEHQSKVTLLEIALKEAEAREATLQNKLGDANGWVFKLSEQRADHQNQLSALARDRDSKRRELDTAKAQMQNLREKIDTLTVENEALINQVAEKTSAPHLSAAQSSFQPALLDSVMHRDKSQLLKRLTITEESPGVAHTGFGRPGAPGSLAEHPGTTLDETASPRPAPYRRETGQVPTRQPMPVVVQTRNLETERLLKETREQAEWLRQLAVATIDSPKPWWWPFMPLSWRRERERKQLQRKGLFDADAYLARYQDVAEAGIDPLSHYLKHGILESRER